MLASAGGGYMNNAVLVSPVQFKLDATSRMLRHGGWGLADHRWRSPHGE